MKKSKNLLLCLCLALAFSGTAATLAGCGDGGKDSSSVSSSVDSSSSGDVAETEYTVSFSVDGTVNEALTQTVLSGDKAAKPESPVKEGYVFAGWYADSAFKTPFNFNNAISQNVTLYARFVEASADNKEFTVTLVVDDEVMETAKTAAGCVYGLPTPEKDGKTFVGWWASDFEDANKLTAQVEDGDSLDENTTLFAVWKSDAPAVSVTATGATWTDMGVGSQYTVVITKPNGESQTIPSATNSVEYVFADAGEYSVKVSVNGKDASTTVYYNNKALARVSQFTEKDGVLTFDKVANATKYLITVQCGDEMHNHVDVDLGDATAFDFSKCAMPAEGIKFTVKAVADGYVTSVSEEFVVLKTLGAVENLAVSADEATWTAVENATSYVVTITYASATETVTVTEASVSLSSYGAGEIKVSVVAEAFGYVSSAAAETTYTKATIAAPTGVKVNGDKVEWSAVEGAAGYVVKIGDKTYDVDTTYIAITDDMIPAGAASVTVSVMAKASDAANNSQYSGAVEVTFGAMADTLKYAASQVTWDAVMNAQKYEVQVNDGEIVEVDGSQNSAAITFDKAGTNVIKVRSYNAAGTASDWVSVEVEAYAITLNGNGGEDKQEIYKATGDTVTPEETTRKGYTFNGWYDMPADGKKYNDTFTFDGAEATTLYAGWVANKYKVTLYNAFGDTEPLAVEEVTYDDSFTLPKGITSETLAMLEFAGWFTEANAGGVRYTDENGDSFGVFKDDRDIVLYASFNEFLRYEEVMNLEGEYTYQVVGGKDIDLLTMVTVPAQVNGKKVTRVGGGAFEMCKNLKTIYLPDTIEYIELGDGGYNGQGNAFYYCSSLEGVYIYETPGTHKRVYKSGEYGELIWENNITQEQTLVFVPKNIEYMVISDEVEVIGANVFASTEIQELIVPASVKKIELGVFYFCDSLHTLTFLEAADGVEASLEIADSDRTFYMMKELANLTLPSHLNRDTNLNMLDNSFRTLKEIKVNATADKGGFYAVDGLLCYGVGADATIVYVPSGFEPANGVFNVPDEIYKIGKGAFSKQYALPSIHTVNISGQVTEIGESAFEGMETLKTVNFQGTKDSTTALNIGKRAFYGCASINTLTMPVNAGTVEANAFGGITGLTKVTLNVSNSAMDLKANAFASLAGDFTVSELVIGAETPAFEVAAVFGGRIATLDVDDNHPNFDDKDNVLFSEGFKQILYVSATKSGEYEVPDTVEEIKANVFANRNISKLIIPASVTVIGNDAFTNCRYLEEIVFKAAGDDVALTVGDNAFKGASNLSKITVDGVTGISLPDRTTKIGAYAFENTALKGNLELPSKVETLNAGAYANTGITSVTIPKELTDIPMGEEQGWVSADAEADPNLTMSVFNMFAGCNALATIEVEAGNTAYVSVDGILYAINEDKTATLLYAPSALAATELNVATTFTANNETYTLTEVASNAFRNMQNVKKITFADSEQAISFGARAFAYDSFTEATSIEEIKLPVGTEEISQQMFYNCTSLKKVNVPYTVSKIGAAAYFNNYALSTLTFDETPANVEEIALELADAGAVKTSGDPEDKEYVTSTFYGCQSLTEVVLPERTTKIGMGVFFTGNYAYEVDGYVNEKWQHGIKKVYVPANVTEFGSYAFAGHLNAQGSITEVVIGANSKLETIGNYAFNYSGLTSFVMPESVTALGKYAFQNSYDLESVVCSSQVVEISQSAFENCTSLATFSFTAGESKLDTISTGAFKASALKSFTVPATVITMKANVFTSCFDLETVTFETYTEGEKAGKSDLALLTNQVFNYCPKLTNIVFPETTGELVFQTVTATFVDCQNLKTVTLPSTVISIDNVFASCGALEEIIISPDNHNLDLSGAMIMNDSGTAIRYCYGQLEGDAEGTYRIASGVQEIGYGAFLGIPNIKKLIIPNTVETIGDYAFASMPDLEEVVFEAGNDVLTVFPAHLFDSCVNLSKVTMPDHLESMAGAKFKSTSYAFYGCASLKEIELPESLIYMGGYMFAGSGLERITVPANVNLTAKATSTSMTSAYLFANCSELKEIEFRNPDNVTALPSRFAYNCSNLTTLKGMEKVEYISSYAFYSCTSFESMDLSNVTFIGGYAFDGCTNLKSVTLGEGLTQLGASKTSITSSSYVFRNTALEEITLPSTLNVLTAANFDKCANLKKVNLGGVKKVGNNSFRDCPNLTEVVGIENVTQLGNAVFQNCTSLEAIDISKVTKVGTQVFDGCTALKEVKFNDGLTSIGNYTFRNCTSLKTVELPTALTSLASSGAFTGSGITSIRVPVGVTSIGAGTFAECKDLQSVTFLGKVTAIGTEAFMGCEKLTTVSLGSVLSQLGDGVFKNCVSLEEIALPSTLASIGIGAFQNTGIRSLYIPAGLSNLGAGAFLNCPNLTAAEITVAPGGVFSMGEDGMLYDLSGAIVWAPADLATVEGLLEDGVLTVTADMFISGSPFSGNTTITKVVVADDVTEIAPEMFRGIENLTEVVLPEGLVTIGNYAFADNPKLVTINIPSTVVSIGEGAFYNTASAIKVDMTNASSLTSIGKKAFEKSGIESVTLPAGITHLPARLFYEATSLTTFKTLGEIKSIGDPTVGYDSTYNLVFAYTKVTEFDASKLEFVGQYAFMLSDIKELHFGAQLATLGDCAVGGVVGSAMKEAYGGAERFDAEMSKVEVVTFADNGKLTTLGDGTQGSVFARLPNLKYVKLPNTLENFKPYAFLECVSLEEVVLPEGLEVIGEMSVGSMYQTTNNSDTFNGCVSLKKITLPSTVKFIGCNAFYGCTNLEEINLPEGLLVIGDEAFSGCAKLSKVTMPASIYIIGEKAFNGCTAIESLTIAKNTDVKNSAFANWTADQTVNFIGDKYSVCVLDITSLNNTNAKFVYEYNK